MMIQYSCNPGHVAKVIDVCLFQFFFKGSEAEGYMKKTVMVTRPISSVQCQSIQSKPVDDSDALMEEEQVLQSCA